MPLLRTLAVVALASWFVPAVARAQPIGTDITSVDLAVLRADFVFIGTIAQASDRPDDSIATVAVEQTLKGSPRDPFRGVLTDDHRSDGLAAFRKGRVLVAGCDDPARRNQFFYLSDPQLEAMTAELRILRTSDAVIEAARAALRDHPGTTKVERTYRTLPHQLVAGTRWASPYFVRVDVPVDAALRRWAEATLDDPEAFDRPSALTAVRHFRSDANIARMRTLLADQASGLYGRPDDNNGIEVRGFPLREPAYDTLRSWGVAVDKPIFKVETFRPEVVERAGIYRQEQATPAEFARLAAFPNLQDLSLTSVSLTPTELRQVGRFDRLHSLSLSGSSGVTDAGLRELAGLIRLRHLDLVRTEITDAGMPVLANFPGLVTLRLNWTRVADAGLPALANMGNLTELDLSYTRVAGSGLKSLTGLGRLRKFTLRGAPVEDAGLAALTQFPALVELELSQTRVTDAGLRHLVGLAGLAALRLEETGVTAAGLPDLARLPGLTKLVLNGTKVTDAGIPTLAGMTQLKDLDIACSRVTAAGGDELRRLRPDMRIYHARRID